MNNILTLQNLTMQFGGVVAVNHCNITVNEGEIVAIIGPNGAGKTTIFNVTTGVYTPTAGKIIFMQKDITCKKPHLITKQGIARTFQNIRLFKELTVLENVLIAKHLHHKSNLLSTTLRMPWAIKEEHKMQKDAETLLEKVGLLGVKNEIASSLSYGEQRRLEIARALATMPKLLLLDEPAAGMNPKETLELTQFIKTIKEEFSITVLMIEHHMDLVMGISDRIYVLNFGELIAEGTANEIQENTRVIEAYLGVEEDA